MCSLHCWGDAFTLFRRHYNPHSGSHSNSFPTRDILTLAGGVSWPSRVEGLMRKLGVIAALVLAVTWQGCSCSDSGAGGNTDGGNGDGGNTDLAVNPDSLSGGDLTIAPADVTLDLQAGGAAASQTYT